MSSIPNTRRLFAGPRGGRAIKAVNLRKHLQIRHQIGFSVAKNASQVARGFRWDEELWGNVQPEDGLAPQVGVAVKDAFSIVVNMRRYFQRMLMFTGMNIGMA